jgi:hypothetical protein
MLGGRVPCEPGRRRRLHGQSQAGVQSQGRDGGHAETVDVEYRRAAGADRGIALAAASPLLVQQWAGLDPRWKEDVARMMLALVDRQ